MRGVLLLAGLCAIAVAESAGRHPILRACRHRGGAAPSTAAAAAAAPASRSSSTALEQYLDEMGEFMALFEREVERASRTCKKNALGFSASAARVRQRPDRRALGTAQRQLAEMYADALAHGSPERLTSFAAASLRLHLLLSLLLREPGAAAAGPTAVGLPSPAAGQLLPPETRAGLESLHAAVWKKPKGTVAEALRELRGALEGPAASHLHLVIVALDRAASASPRADGAAAAHRAGQGGAEPAGPRVGEAGAFAPAAAGPEFEAQLEAYVAEQVAEARAAVREEEGELAAQLEAARAQAAAIELRASQLADELAVAQSSGRDGAEQASRAARAEHSDRVAALEAELAAGAAALEARDRSGAALRAQLNEAEQVCTRRVTAVQPPCATAM